MFDTADRLANGVSRLAGAAEAIAARIWWHGFAWGAASMLLAVLAVAVLVLIIRQR